MTQDFSRGYLPPGVYVEEDESVVVNATGIAPTLVGLVGQTRGYQVYTEQIVLSDDGSVLTQQGINTASVVLEIVDTHEAVAPSDYDLSTTGTGHATITTLTRDGSADVDDGTVCWATYHYTDSEYFNPKLVTTFEDVKDLYGEPLNLSPADIGETDYVHVLSPLSLAAKIAMDNGAVELVLCAAEPPVGGSAAALSTSRRTKLSEAMERTATISAVNVLVPITSDIATADAPGVLTDVNAHVNDTFADEVLRFVVVGFDAAVATEPDDLLSGSSVQNRRVMLAYATPGGLMMFSGSTNTTFAASHTYLAAAYAGVMANNPVQRALTKKNIVGFTGLSGTPLSNALKNQYAQAGVAISEIDRLGRLTVRHGVTTDMTNINTREASVVRARDALVTLVRDGFADSGLNGEPIDEEMVYSVKSVMQGYLETAVQSETIVGWTGLSTRQRPSDPSVIEIKFSYKPAYPLNYIAISFSIDTSTGTVNETTLEAA